MSDLDIEYEELKQRYSEQEPLITLGMISAGIVHELKNPLHFVLNFAKVARSLLEEISGPESQDIQKHLNHNLELLEHHAQRAQNIVTNVLALARGSQVLTLQEVNLNSLVDLYAMFAYYALRDQHPGFNVRIVKDYLTPAPVIKVYEAELGRAVLNIVDNALAAMYEKSLSATEGYSPTLTLKTSFIDKKAFISIKDNGPGIPKSVQRKIFEPLFSTKKQGTGTGLGLSIAQDIVVKHHHGKIDLKTSAEGSEFTIQLPVGG